MKVQLATAYPTKWSYLPRFRELAAMDRFGVHTVTDDPEQAELILFVDARHEHGDWRFRALRNHPLARRFRPKCFVYNETDQPWCCMPGLYVSMPKLWFDPQHMAAWSYIGLMNPYLENGTGEGLDQPADLLFSFAGRRCVPVRDEVLKLRHPNALIGDTTDFNFFGSANRTVEEMDAQRRSYAQTIRRSRFVICPRGSGPASFRLFEALAAGRVPVILSDEWVAPEGPDWNACSLRVPEADAATLPDLLEVADRHWPALSASARTTWDEWFAPEAQFHRIVEAIDRLRQNGRWLSPKSVGRWLWLEARGIKSQVRVRLRRPAFGGGPS